MDFWFEDCQRFKCFYCENTTRLLESTSEGFAAEEQTLFMQKVELIVEHLFNQVCLIFCILISHPPIIFVKWSLKLTFDFLFYNFLKNHCCKYTHLMGCTDWATRYHSHFLLRHYHVGKQKTVDTTIHVNLAQPLLKIWSIIFT